MYDRNNVFAKILRQEIKCDKVYENNYTLAFKDIFPKAKVHVLVIPKGEYIDLTDFLSKATNDEIQGYFSSFLEIVKILNLESGYRVLSNCGKNGHQEVAHLHFHILGGENLKSF